MTSFNLNQLPKGPISKYSHIRGQGFDIGILRKHNSVYNRGYEVWLVTWTFAGFSLSKNISQAERIALCSFICSLWLPASWAGNQVALKQEAHRQDRGKNQGRTGQLPLCNPPAPLGLCLCSAVIRNFISSVFPRKILSALGFLLSDNESTKL